MDAFQKIRPKIQFLSLQWLWAAAAFALGAGSTFISYRPYRLMWDDSDSVVRSMMLSRSLWAGDWPGVLRATVNTHPPVLSLLGFPWGPIASWDAVGRYLVSLALLTSLAACISLYLIFRSGVKWPLLVAAVLSVAAALGPFPSRPRLYGGYMPGAHAHWYATALMSDSLLAWTTLAAVLLIPFEVRTPSSSGASPRWRGVLWAAIISLGTITKLDFLYFAFLIVPALYLIRSRKWGRDDARKALGAFAWIIVPLGLYFLIYDRLALGLLGASSFGKNADNYSFPLLNFLKTNVAQAPGLLLWFFAVAAALIYLVSRRRHSVSKADLYAVLVVIGFGVILLLSTNREIRYAFPTIVSLPFLLAILLSDKVQAASARSAAVLSGLVFCALAVASVPMLHRPARDVLSRSDAVLDLADRCHATKVLIATDSPSLNVPLFNVDLAISSQLGRVWVSTVAYGMATGTSLQSDFQDISRSDLIVFQDRAALTPAFSNVRVSEYDRYVRHAGYLATRVGPDLIAYSFRCNAESVSAQALRASAKTAK